jgi:hypothetical protein
MKKRILGITALLAVLAMVLAFTACDGLLDKTDPDAVYEVTFINNSAAEIDIVCLNSTPSTFTLKAAASTGDDTQRQLVTRKGKEIELSTIEITIPSLTDPWDYVEVTGSAVPGSTKGKNGLTLKAGTIKFSAVKGNGYLDYKIDTIAE